MERWLNIVLRLSINSFHYRTVKYVMGEEYFLGRINLCKYFWTVVVSMLALPFFAIGAGFVILTKNVRWPKIHWPEVKMPRQRSILLRQILYTGLVSGWIVYEFYFHLYYWTIPLVAMIFFIWFGEWIVDAIEEWNDDRKKKKPPKPKKIPKPPEPNLAWEYIKARKARICPYIVWEDM